MKRFGMLLVRAVAKKTGRAGANSYLEAANATLFAQQQYRLHGRFKGLD